jgi:hypothetical protein
METVCSCGRTAMRPKVQGCHYKMLIDFVHNNHRDRYHENAIILHIISSLVSISVSSLLVPVLSIVGIMWSLNRHVQGFEHPYFHAMILSLMFDSNIIIATYIQKNAPIINCHASLRLLCHTSMWFLKRYAQLIHCTILCQTVYQIITLTLTSCKT